MERFNAQSNLYHGSMKGGAGKRNTQEPGIQKRSPRSSKKADSSDSQGITAFRKANRMLTLEINKLRKELEREKIKNEGLTKKLSTYTI